jgi:hypothetical protein
VEDSGSPRLHIFLWLLANNKILTRDNLAKRKRIDDKTCLFYNEFESVGHLFFYCCIAPVIWDELCDMTSLPLVTDFEFVGSMWIKGKKYKAYNILTLAVIWSIWKLKNKFRSLVQGGGGATWSGQASQELGDAQQNGGDNVAGGVGKRAKRKRHKTSKTAVVTCFKIFGF